MLARKYLFPRVIEMNYQAGRRLGVNVYLLDGGSEFLLIDIGYLDTVDGDHRADPAHGLQPVHLQDDHRHARRRRPHPGPGPRQGAAQDQGGRPSAQRRAAGVRRRDHDLRLHQGPGHRDPHAALQDRHAAQRRRHHRRRRSASEGLAHARPHGRPSQLQDGQPAFQRRQHLQGQLRRRHRRPSRLEPAATSSSRSSASTATTPSFCCPATDPSSAAIRASSRRPSTA